MESLHWSAFIEQKKEDLIELIFQSTSNRRYSVVVGH